MTLKHYLNDVVLALGERTYWSYYLATRRDSPRKPPETELVQLRRDLAAAERAAPAGPAGSLAMALLVQTSNALVALQRGAGDQLNPDDLALSLNLWAALQHYRAAACPGGLSMQQEALRTLEPMAWRWDDRRGVLLLDLDEGLTLRLWLDLALPKRLDILRPSHVHTLVYETASRVFTNPAGERCDIRELVDAPSTHVYLTRSIARFFPKPAAVHRPGPVAATTTGQTGSLF